MLFGLNAIFPNGGSVYTKEFIEKAKKKLERPVEENPLDKVIVDHLPGSDNKHVNEVYQARWVWYHTILCLELFFTNILLFIIAIILMVK